MKFVWLSNSSQVNTCVFNFTDIYSYVTFLILDKTERWTSMVSRTKRDELICEIQILAELLILPNQLNI